MRNVKSKVRKLLNGIIEDPNVVEYFAEMARYCVRNDIHEFDIVIQRDLYPILAKKYDKPTSSIEKELISVLKKEWGNMDIELYKERFNYNSKPTVRKLLILILRNIKSN